MSPPEADWHRKAKGKLEKVFANNRTGTLPRRVETPQLLPDIERGYYESLLDLYNQFRDRLLRILDNAQPRLLSFTKAEDTPSFNSTLDKFGELMVQAAAQFLDTAATLGRDYLAATAGFDPFEGMEEDLDNVFNTELNTFKAAVDRLLTDRVIEAVEREAKEDLAKSEGEDLVKARTGWSFKRIRALLKSYGGAVFSVFNAVTLVGSFNIIHRRLSPSIIESTGEAIDEAGNVELEWVGIGDEATCPTCFDMIEGSPYGPGELISTGIWPGHNTQCGGNCRCFLRPTTAGIDADLIEEITEASSGIAELVADAKKVVGFLRVRTNISVPKTTTLVGTLVQRGAAADGVAVPTAVTLTTDQLQILTEAVVQTPLLRRREWLSPLGGFRIGASALPIEGNYIPSTRVIELTPAALSDVTTARRIISHEIGHDIWARTSAGKSAAFRSEVERLRAARVRALRGEVERVRPDARVLKDLTPEKMLAIWEKATLTQDFTKVGRIINELNDMGQTAGRYGYKSLFSSEEYFSEFFALMAESPVTARILDHPMEVTFYNNFRGAFEAFVSRRFAIVQQASELNLGRVSLPARARHLRSLPPDMKRADVLQLAVTPPELYQANFPAAPKGIPYVYDLPTEGILLRLFARRTPEGAWESSIGLPSGALRSEFFNNLRGIHVAYDPSQFEVVDKATGQLRNLTTGERNALRSAGYISKGEFRKRFGNVVSAYDADERIIYIDYDRWVDLAIPVIKRRRIERPRKVGKPVVDIFEGILDDDLVENFAVAKRPPVTPPVPFRPPDIPLTPTEEAYVFAELASRVFLTGDDLAALPGLPIVEYTQVHRNIILFNLGLHNYQMLKEARLLAPVREAYYNYVVIAIGSMRDRFAALGWKGFEKRAVSMLNVLERTPGRVPASVQDRLSVTARQSLQSKAQQLRGGLLDVNVFSPVSLQSERDFFASWFQLYTEDPSQAAYYADDLITVVRETLRKGFSVPKPFTPQLKPSLDEAAFLSGVKKNLEFKSLVVTPDLGFRKITQFESRWLKGATRVIIDHVGNTHPLLVDPKFLKQFGGVSVGYTSPSSVERSVSVGGFSPPKKLSLFLRPSSKTSTVATDTPALLKEGTRIFAHEFGHHMLRLPIERRYILAVEQEYLEKISVLGAEIQRVLTARPDIVNPGLVLTDITTIHDKDITIREIVTLMQEKPKVFSNLRLLGGKAATLLEALFDPIARSGIPVPALLAFPSTYAPGAQDEYFAEVFELFARGGNSTNMVRREYPSVYNLIQQTFFKDNPALLTQQAVEGARTFEVLRLPDPVLFTPERAALGREYALREIGPHVDTAPGLLFHETDIRGALSILRSGKVQPLNIREGINPIDPDSLADVNEEFVFTTKYRDVNVGSISVGGADVIFVIDGDLIRAPLYRDRQAEGDLHAVHGVIDLIDAIKGIVIDANEVTGHQLTTLTQLVTLIRRRRPNFFIESFRGSERGTIKVRGIREKGDI